MAFQLPNLLIQCLLFFIFIINNLSATAICFKWLERQKSNQLMSAQLTEKFISPLKPSTEKPDITQKALDNCTANKF